MAFQITNNSNTITVNTGNPNLDGTGTITSLFIANGPYGSVLNLIRINTYTAVSVGMIRIFLKKPVAMAPWTLFKEVMIPESPNNNPPYPVYNASIELNLPLMQNYEVGISTQNNENFILTGFGYDITGFI